MKRAIVFVLTVGLFVYVVFGVFFPRVRDAARRASGGNDLGQARLTALLYTEDHSGTLPPLDSEPGRLMFSRDLFPDYCPFLSSITCEFDTTAPASQHTIDDKEFRIAKNLDDHSMIYLGYFLENEEQGLAFVEAYKARAASGGDFMSNLDAQQSKGSFGTDQFVRLTIDASEIAALSDGRIGELTASIPVMIERPEHYDRAGGWVAYMAGPSRWHDYPGEWPMTERFIEALRSLDRLGPETR
jgi:hypothetical protein